MKTSHYNVIQKISNMISRQSRGRLSTYREKILTLHVTKPNARREQSPCAPKCNEIDSEFLAATTVTYPSSSLLAKPLSRVMVDMMPVALEPIMSVPNYSKVTLTMHLYTPTSTNTDRMLQLSVASVRGKGSHSASAPSSVGCPRKPFSTNGSVAKDFGHSI